ncbi:MAG: putative transposase [Parasphingorhabdus sp.]|jgi:putative transposase
MLNGVYTQASNRIYQKVSHVFQGRYKAILVQKETYLLELARYIVLNPVRARMVRQAKSWCRSSYLATAGFRETPDWLTTEWLLAAFSQQKGKVLQNRIGDLGNQRRRNIGIVQFLQCFGNLSRAQSLGIQT